MSSARPAFPAARLPDDPAQAKLLGLYPQVQDGLWLQRVKILAGILAADQWQALADIARKYTPHTPLHLTTRQDIEIHDLRPQDIPGVQRDMAASRLTSVGAAGDTLRNVTVCPCSGLACGTPDLSRVARRIRHLLEEQEAVWALPRKFKVSLSACGRGCGQPFINDVGLTAERRGSKWGFRVIVAGSLGTKPALGVELYDWLPTGDILPLVLAAFRVFAQHGDRTNRAKARLRHVRQRVGDEAFAATVKEAFAVARAELSAADTAVEMPAASAFEGKVTLSFLGGDVSASAAESLAHLANHDDVQLRISNHHRVIAFGKNKATLAAHLARSPELVAAALPQPAIVACPGKRWCKRGIVSTLPIAQRIREQLAETIRPDATICISGCPNGCAQSAVADIGLIGSLTTVDGAPCEACSVLTGGGMGRDDRLAMPAFQRVPVTDLIDRLGGLETV